MLVLLRFCNAVRVIDQHTFGGLIGTPKEALHKVSESDFKNVKC